MPRLSPLPEQFHQTVFSRREALAAGRTDRVLAGLPRARGHRRRIDRTADGYRVHRFQGSLFLEDVDGLRLVGAARTFVDCGTVLSWQELVVVGDWMIAKGNVERLDLLAFVHAVHFDGVQRARRAMEWVREGSASPQETRVRLILVLGGLPEPELNGLITDAHGGFLAYGDLVYRPERVVIEYDGWQHERDARQRQHDLRRRELLEAEGWRVVVVTVADLTNPTMVFKRVVDALRRARCA